jgi:hypothetical protein
MARIVAVHGIGQAFEGANLLCARWLPALRDGLDRAEGSPIADDDLACAFYGDLFRPAGKSLALAYEPKDVESEWERALLEAWWDEAAALQPALPRAGDAGKARTPGFVQGALRALSRSDFFASISQRALIGDLKQVHAYLHDAAVREQAQQRIAAAVGSDTLVLLAHSLGSVVAYEYLCRQPQAPIRAFVTLGSPLGIRKLIFDRLQPPPVGGVGRWPGAVRQWTNIADGGDVVALAKALRPLFDGPVDDRLVHNGSQAHDILRYLSTAELGRAVRQGLEA